MGRGILETWYEFEKRIRPQGSKKFPKSAFVIKLFPQEMREKLFPKGKCRYVKDIVYRDTFDIYRIDNSYCTKKNKNKPTQRKEGGYVGNIEEISLSINLGGDFKKRELAHLNAVVDSYKSRWYELVEDMAGVFSESDNRFSVNANCAMSNYFDTVMRDSEGKKVLAEGLYNCICLIFTGKCDPTAEWEINEEKDKKDYQEYIDVFKKYGRYSYHSDLMIKKLADAGNRYAMFNLAQMYYYGKGIVSEKRFDKTYEIYDKLNASKWKYPLFLWARADFIIEYFDSRFKEGGTFYQICIPQLDRQQNHSTYARLLLDLTMAEKSGCGSAANLCGNILAGKALKKECLDKDTNYDVLMKTLLRSGDKLKHYQIGARNGNTYSYYQLFLVYLDEFFFEFSVENAIEDLKQAIKFLQNSAETENPRAINEIALVHILGIKKYIIKKLNERTSDHLPEMESKRIAIDAMYNDDDMLDLLEAYYYLNRIYDSSIKRSDFKWPVNNMIEHIYMNPSFLEICESRISDANELERVIAKATNIQEQIEDIDIALSTLKYSEANKKVRNALERTREEIIKENVSKLGK